MVLFRVIEGMGERKGVHFHSIELLFLGYDLVDVRCQERVCVYDLCSDGALDGGLDFGF